MRHSYLSRPEEDDLRYVAYATQDDCKRHPWEDVCIIALPRSVHLPINGDRFEWRAACKHTLALRVNIDKYMYV